MPVRSQLTRKSSLHGKLKNKDPRVKGKYSLSETLFFCSRKEVLSKNIHVIFIIWFPPYFRKAWKTECLVSNLYQRTMMYERNECRLNESVYTICSNSRPINSNLTHISIITSSITDNSIYSPNGTMRCSQQRFFLLLQISKLSRHYSSKFKNLLDSFIETLKNGQSQMAYNILSNKIHSSFTKL